MDEIFIKKRKKTPKNRNFFNKKCDRFGLVPNLSYPLGLKKKKKKEGRSELSLFILGLIQASRASQISQTNLVWPEIMSRSLMVMV